MGLRYKGAPSRSSNRQVDKLPELCFCKFVGVGKPMEDGECELHSGPHPCDRCPCFDYRPKYVKEYPGHWPLCMCGHIAQEHNTRSRYYGDD